MGREHTIDQDGAVATFDEQEFYADEYDQDGVSGVCELHAQHEGSRNAVVHSLDDSPETSIVRYSYWSIM